MNIRKYKNKLLGEYYSVSIDELKKDNLLTALYVCKYHSRVKLGSEHMKKTLMKWKSELKQPKTLNEDLGNTLKMNIKLNTKPVYSKYKKTYKDVELTMNKEGLYKPVLRNMVTGGATGFTVPFVNIFSKNFKRENKGKTGTSVKALRNIQYQPKTQPKQKIYIEVEPIAKLALKKHKLVINESDKQELLNENSNVQQIDIPSTVNIDNLQALMDKGYCVFNDDKGELFKNYEDLTCICIPSVPTIVTMSQFYFGTDSITVDQKTKLMKIVYVLHYDKDRTNIKEPIAIQSNINSQSGGGKTKKLKKTKTKVNKKLGGDTNTESNNNEPEIYAQGENVDSRRGIFFYAINHESIGLKRFVIKIGLDEDEGPYTMERLNYEELKKRNTFLNDNLITKTSLINNFMNGGSQQKYPYEEQFEGFYETHITKHYEAHGHTDGTIKISSSEFDLEGDDITIGIKKIQSYYKVAKKDMEAELKRDYEHNQYYLEHLERKQVAATADRKKFIEEEIKRLKTENDDLIKRGFKWDGFYYFVTEYDVKFETIDTTFDKLNNTYKRLGLAKAYENVDKVFTNVINTHRQAMEKYGFYHGDLKPDNVLINIDNRETVKIFDLDFSGFVCKQEALLEDYEKRTDDSFIKRNFERFELYEMKYAQTWGKWFTNMKKRILCASDKCTRPEHIPMKYFMHAHDIWRMFYTMLYFVPWLQKLEIDNTSSILRTLIIYDKSLSSFTSRITDANSVKRIVKCMMNLGDYRNTATQINCANKKMTSAEL